jgi:acetyltransferase-like isoleucine patch superfamily enzyme
MLLSLSQYYLKEWKPAFSAWLTRLVYAGGRVKIGDNFKADTLPRIIVDKGAELIIGNNVELRRNVEIRVHGHARVVIGDNVRIDRGVRILAANKAVISIGTGTRIGLYTVLNGGDSITLEEKVLVSGFVYLQTSMHGYANKNMSVQDQGYDHAPVVLKEDVWLGTHVVVLPGCVLGKGAVVGSNAVVTKSVEEYNVVAGIPAKPLKERI